MNINLTENNNIPVVQRRTGTTNLFLDIDSPVRESLSIIPNDFFIDFCGEDVAKEFKKVKEEVENTKEGEYRILSGRIRSHVILNGLDRTTKYYRKLIDLRELVKKKIEEIERAQEKTKLLANEVEELAVILHPKISEILKLNIGEKILELIETNTGAKLKLQSLNIVLNWVNREIKCIEYFINKIANRDTPSVDSSAICKICFDRRIDNILDSCKHAFCEKCIMELLKEISPKCPYCHANFSSFTKIFF